MAVIERYKSCRKCGQVNEHSLEWTEDSSGNHILVTCSVCGFWDFEPCADADAPKPKVTELDLVVAVKTWARTDSLTFEAWLQKQVRIQGGRFW